MPEPRYTLARQLHFVAENPQHREVVITIQRWQSKTSKTAVYVQLHNGREVVRRVCSSTADLTQLDTSFTKAEAQFAEYLLSDDAAADEVTRRGGPTIQYCRDGRCGAQIPFGASQCAEGHTADYVGAGRNVFGLNRRPPITLHTGDQK